MIKSTIVWALKQYIQPTRRKVLAKESWGKTIEMLKNNIQSIRPEHQGTEKTLNVLQDTWYLYQSPLLRKEHYSIFIDGESLV